MLRLVRQKLRMIRYYSAPRQQSAWTRAMDVAFVGSMVLALPMVWMCDLMHGSPRTAISISGELSRQTSGEVTAIVLSTSDSSRSSIISGTPLGIFQIEVNDYHHGWPLTTSIRREPATITVDLREEVRARKNALLAADDPLRIAMEAALLRDEQHETLAAWLTPNENSSPQSAVFVRRHWISWLGAAAIWWIMLTFTSAFAIQVSRFGWLILQSKTATRRMRLRAEGKCSACGYDMTGLEFNERCPECGELVW